MFIPNANKVRVCRYNCFCKRLGYKDRLLSLFLKKMRREKRSSYPSNEGHSFKRLLLLTTYSLYEESEKCSNILVNTAADAIRHVLRVYQENMRDIGVYPTQRTRV